MKSKAASKARSKRSKSKRDISAPSSLVVGVGASAGGLEALRAMISNVKDLSGTSLVVVQHLSPQHRSMLVDLISRETSIAVKEVEDGATPQPNTIYITPPNANIVFRDGALRLAAPTGIGPKPSVNLFLESLAEELGERAAAVILSGTGTDGARGMAAIKAAGGITLAQSASTAKYDGMPVAAIDSGAVDIVADAEKIGRELGRLRRYSESVLRVDDNTPEDPVHAIFAKIKAESGVDFLLYKPSTIRRRLHRRMLANGVESVDRYLKILEKNPEESGLLYQDILISVTSFFRDPAAFRELARHLARQMKSSQYRDGVFRVWVPGCATGEEVYTIAMILSEVIRKLKLNVRMQIFATDISEPALNMARAAIYPESAVGRMPAECKARYLVRSENNYRVKKAIRDSVIFARQDILRDPPFLKLDLITCRNLLIYFGQEAQDRTFKMFQYALNPGGLLMLGKSESVGKHEKFFRPLSQRSRIYTRTNSVAESPRAAQSGGLLKGEPATHAAYLTLAKAQAESIARLLPQIAPDSAVVDESFTVKKVYGEMRQILELADGEVSHSLLKLMPPELRSECATLLHRAKKDHRRAVGFVREVEVRKVARVVQISVVPFTLDGISEFLVELIRNEPVPKRKETPKPKASTGVSAERVRELEEELNAAKEHLQTAVEELETSNEELQALNEELQSANEELQSANEELETSNEELHSTNEELTTLNEELNVKSMEAAALNESLEAVQDAVKYPIFVVDQNMNLARHNAACSTIFRLDEAAVGRNVRLVAGDEDLEEIFARVERCLLEGIETKDERIKAGRRRYNIQVKALSGENGGVTGAMVILVDMTEYLAALKNSRDKESILRSILSNTPAIVSLKNPSGRYGFVNSPFLRQFKLKRDQVLGKTDEEIFGERIATEIRSRDFEVLSRREPVTYEEEIELEGQKLILLTSKMPLLDSKFSPRSVCTISLDITKRRAAEEVIRDQREQLVRVNKLSALGEMAAGIAHEINTPLNTILANTELIELMCAKDPVARAEICESARKIGKTVTSISDIVTGLRQLARMDTHIGFAVHDLCQLLRDTVRVCELNLRNHGTRVEIKVPDCVVQVKCNPVQLSQVIINLINNAIDAVADRDDRWIEITVAERAKDVEVRVTDSGDGIPSELASKIMAPFFTTKAKDKGTGMGLSISQSIIRMHKGELVLDPNHDHTSFVILLPRAHSEKEALVGEH